MKFFLHTLAIALGLCALTATLQAELLIVKKGPDGTFQALDESDARNNLHITYAKNMYQWPMCLASGVPRSEELAELFAAGKPYAEELFVQNQLRESSGVEYSVVFIPTLIYELFCILQTFTEGTENSFRKAVAKICLTDRSGEQDERWQLRYKITKLVNNLSNASPMKLREELYNAYYKSSYFFLNTYIGTFSPSFFINNALVTRLFDMNPDLKNEPDALALSNAIEKSMAYPIVKALIEQLTTLDERQLMLPNTSRRTSGDIVTVPIELIKRLRKEEENKVIYQVLALEYAARYQNKALILRGTKLHQMQVALKEQKFLAGNTINKKKKDTAPLEETYGKKEDTPYSISFGNSLFAGALRDPTACAYTYLSPEEKTHKPIGYALFIDKAAYIQHQCNNLFFISPVAPIAGIFQNGEYFHSRTKAAVSKKAPEGHDITGIFYTGAKLKDPMGVFLITRDQLHHAELFSNFVAENGHFIQFGDESTLTPEERSFVKDVKVSQAKAAAFYRALRTTTPKVQRAIKAYRQRKLAIPDRANAATPDAVTPTADIGN